MASAAVYGEALLLGQRPEAKALAAELRALSDGYLDGPAEFVVAQPPTALAA
jgi:hypothetical protein